MARFSKTCILSILFLFVPLGCVKMALRMNPSIVQHFADTIFEECDTKLAETAIPANLKLMEGLLKNDPNNREILTTLSMGFSGYSMLFVEQEDPERASDLFLRARDYGLKALGKRWPALNHQGLRRDELKGLLSRMDDEDINPLLWTTISWSGWINLNLDQPAAIAQLALTQTCLEKIIELDGNILYGLPNILMGISLAARPPMLGGSPERAKGFFEAAIENGQGKFFFAQYHYARYYAVRVQDKALFLKLIKDILEGDPSELGDVCMINSVIQKEAEKLKQMVDELFI